MKKWNEKLKGFYKEASELGPDKQYWDQLNTPGKVVVGIGHFLSSVFYGIIFLIAISIIKVSGWWRITFKKLFFKKAK